MQTLRTSFPTSPVRLAALFTLLVAALAFTAHAQPESCDRPSPSMPLVKPPQDVEAYGVFCFEQCKLGHFRINTTEGFCGIGQNCPLAGDNGPVGVAIPNRPCRIPFIAGWHLRVRGHQKSGCGIPEDPSCQYCVIGHEDLTPADLHPALEYFVYSNRFEPTARDNSLLLHPEGVESVSEDAGVWVDFPIVPDNPADPDGQPSCAVTTAACPNACPPNDRGKVPQSCHDERDMRPFCHHKTTLDLPLQPLGDQIFNDAQVRVLQSGRRYGKLKVGSTSKVRLEAGDYEFAEFRVEKNGRVVAEGEVNILVRGTTSLAGHLYAVPLGFQGDPFASPAQVAHDPAAPPIKIMVDPVASLNDVSLGTNNEYDVDVCYPRDGGVIGPGEGNTIRGRLVAWKVIGGEDNEFRCHN